MSFHSEGAFCATDTCAVRQCSESLAIYVRDPHLHCTKRSAVQVSPPLRVTFLQARLSSCERFRAESAARGECVSPLPSPTLAAPDSNGIHPARSVDVHGYPGVEGLESIADELSRPLDVYSLEILRCCCGSLRCRHACICTAHQNDQIHFIAEELSRRGRHPPVAADRTCFARRNHCHGKLHLRIGRHTFRQCVRFAAHGISACEG